ncbi:MAG: protein translocase subunit SecF [Candidatus Andersenbacteria bacterium]
MTTQPTPRKPLPIVRLRWVWYSISLVLLASTVVLIATGGLKLGIDFAGGTLHKVTFTTTRPDTPTLTTAVDAVVGTATVQPTGSKDVTLRYANVDNAKRQELLDTLSKKFGKVDELSFDSVGPTIGNELKRKAFYATALVMLGIILYLTYAFRKVSEPVKSWQYGVLAIVTLLHDVGAVVGVFALLGHLQGAQVDSLFLVAVLTTLGYSVHDTIVVFDRTRTNLLRLGSDQFVKAVELATNQTIGRSVNTSLTAVISLVALLVFGGSSLFDFILALLVGVVVGTYSSIFVASPLLVSWFRLSERRRLRRMAA